jgi:hypothetical protein
MALRGLRAVAMLALAAGAAALAGCGSGDARPVAAAATAAATTATPAAAPGPAWTDGYPNSIAVLGHSGSTGENSDPKQPGVEVRANSWATGTNPAVDSLYLRILAHNPAIRGRNFSLSEGGAGIEQVSAQADRLVATHPDVGLVVIQVMDADLTCPLDRTALADFRAKLTAMLRKLAQGAPDAREFVVSQFGSVPTYARSLTRAERASQGGTGPCDFMTPAGGIAPRKAARLESAIHAYEGALRSACGEVRQCAYDGGAFGSIVDRREYVSSDLNHFSITGHAEAAAVAWAAMRRTGVVRPPG